MANINRQWKKFIAAGCSHGHLADPKALKAVLDFTDRYKPDTRIHLGDFTDQAAFRSGAKGTRDETASIKDDLTSGLRFLQEFRPTILFNGNHEDRLWNLAEHHNEIVSMAATAVINEICSLAGKLKARHIDHYDINRSYLKIGDTAIFHGWMFNEMAIRDHAEHFGKCLFAHLHRCASSPARRSDRATGYCVGWLGDERQMGYAKNRRATAQWSQGFAWGEYSDRETVIYLLKRGESGWRLPF